MRVIRAAGFTAARAWDALDVARFDGVTVRLHWTDASYAWHVNDGAEVFVVLDGEVDMHTRTVEGKRVVRLAPGDIFHAEPGNAHRARPLGAARILVVERAGSA